MTSNVRRYVRRGAAPLAVLGGGLVGSAGRWLVFELFVGERASFPTATLVVNLAGALALGFYLARWERAPASQLSLRFWAIGVLGSFTTFSAFSFEVFELLDAGRGLPAGVYVATSMLGGLAAALLGDRLGEATR